MPIAYGVHSACWNGGGAPLWGWCVPEDDPACRRLPLVQVLTMTEVAARLFDLVVRGGCHWHTMWLSRYCLLHPLCPSPIVCPAPLVYLPPILWLTRLVLCTSRAPLAPHPQERRGFEAALFTSCSCAT